MLERRRNEESPRDGQDEWEELKFTTRSTRSYVTLQPDLPITHVHTSHKKVCEAPSRQITGSHSHTVEVLNHLDSKNKKERKETSAPTQQHLANNSDVTSWPLGSLI